MVGRPETWFSAIRALCAPLCMAFISGRAIIGLPSWWTRATSDLVGVSNLSMPVPGQFGFMKSARRREAALHMLCAYKRNAK